MKRTRCLTILVLAVFLGALAFLLFDSSGDAPSKAQIYRKHREAPITTRKVALSKPQGSRSFAKETITPKTRTLKFKPENPAKKTKRFRGKVIDEKGQGIPNCLVKIDYDSFDYPRPQCFPYLEEDLHRLKLKNGVVQDSIPEEEKEEEEPVFKTVTDAQGLFFIDLEVPVEIQVVLYLTPPVEYQSYCKPISTPKDRDFGEITLGPACRLSGKVLDSFDQELSEMPVLLMTANAFRIYLAKKELQGQLTSYFITKEDGQFQFKNLPPGSYYLLAKSEHHIETQLPIRLNPGDNEATLYLSDPRTLEVTFKNSRKIPRANVNILLRKVDYWPLKDSDSIEARSNEDGIAQCFNLIHREYELTA
ncbi:MAG: SpaA isopeptide-forming pilin-related protein, partial [Planctomycetota bacterium]|nr:SpaA isopeptide-forming pilin-related protein [Planctomycetota bacterium]